MKAREREKNNKEQKIDNKKNNVKKGIGKILLVDVALIFGLLFTFISGTYIGKKRGIPLLYRETAYSIGIYKGDTPLNLKPDPEVHNPVITYKDVNDIKADFVADPFLIKYNEKWYLFFEVFNKTTHQGDIGCAKSNDGINWKYDKIVLDLKYHLSYPYVFKNNNDMYMIPESHQNYTVSLYKANNFPYNWIFIKDLLHGDYSDPGIIYHNGYWWMFVSDRIDILHLFYSKNLEGPWIEHPKSPIVFKNSHYARSGGRIVTLGDSIIRFAQDCSKTYGEKVNAIIITELTPLTYTEKPYDKNPVLEGTRKGWNALRMHQCDPLRIDNNTWIAAVDGVGGPFKLGRRY